jgi:hypothetical protein
MTDETMHSQPANGSARRASSSCSPLAAVERAFALLVAPPAPLALDGRGVGQGLPARHIPLDELRRLLLRGSASYAAKDGCWHQLIDHARTWGPAWVVGAVGMALPALTRMAGRLSSGHARQAEDIEAELLAGYLAGLRGADLSGPAPYVRLCWIAWRAALAARCGEEPVEVPETAEPWGRTPARPYGHPDLILGRAVALAVISDEQRQLIEATRLDRELVEDIAARTGVAASALRMRRRRGELKLLTALERGLLDPDSAAVAAGQRRRRREDPVSAGVRTSVRNGGRSPGLTDPDWQVRDRRDRPAPRAGTGGSARPVGGREAGTPVTVLTPRIADSA